jgi:hypothetical protein
MKHKRPGFQGLENIFRNFPGIGKSRGIFSKAWKNSGENFQALENVWMTNASTAAGCVVKDPCGLAPQVNEFGCYGVLAEERLPLPRKAAGAVTIRGVLHP